MHPPKSLGANCHLYDARLALRGAPECLDEDGRGAISRNRSLQTRQVLHPVHHFPHDPQQRGHELLVDIHHAFVLGEIPLPVCLIEDSPLLGRQVDRVLQALEDQIARPGSVTPGEQSLPDGS